MTGAEKKVLKKLVYHLELLSASVAALENAAKSDTLGGRKLTKRQFGELRNAALREHAEVFDKLDSLIQALPSKQ